MDSPVDQCIWTTREVGEYLGFSVARVRQAVKERGLPAQRVAQRYYFEPEKVKAWTSAQGYLALMKDAGDDVRAYVREGLR